MLIYCAWPPSPLPSNRSRGSRKLSLASQITPTERASYVIVHRSLSYFAKIKSSELVIYVVMDVDATLTKLSAEPFFLFFDFFFFEFKI